MIGNKKILICAYSCEPGFSSEQEIGWKWTTLLSEKNDLFVLTRESNKNTIEDFRKKNNIKNNIKYIYYDLPNWAKKWKRGEKGLYLYYTLWQFGAYLKAKKINKKENFDIVHYLTFGSILLPQFMFLMPNKFVWGPIGGGETIPLKFINDFSKKGKFVEIIRHFVHNMLKYNPFLFLQCYKSSKILVRSKETYNMIPKIFRNKTELMLETGTPEELLNYKSNQISTKKELQIITVGRFVNWKINLLTLKTILNFKEKYNVPFKYYLIGDGYEEDNLKNFVRENNLQDNVVFTGRIPREEVFNYLSQSDIYFSTTFKEGGSWAFFEAVAIGLPVVCLKVSGPDMIVADNCGIKIELTNPEEVINKLTEGLYSLSQDKELRLRLSIAAKKVLINDLSWNNIMYRINNIYNNLLRK